MCHGNGNRTSTRLLLPVCTQLFLVSVATSTISDKNGGCLTHQTVIIDCTSHFVRCNPENLFSHEK